MDLSAIFAARDRDLSTDPYCGKDGSGISTANRGLGDSKVLEMITYRLECSDRPIKVDYDR